MTAVPFPSNPRRPTSSPASGISPEASSPPRGTIAALQSISAPPTQEAWQAHLARHAESPEPPRQDFDRGMLARLSDPLTDDDPQPALTVLILAAAAAVILLAGALAFQWVLT
jgi:hypothetical protein